MCSPAGNGCKNYSFTKKIRLRKLESSIFRNKCHKIIEIGLSAKMYEQC